MESGRLHIGTCSWTDRTFLKSGFYPASARTPAARLAYYAAQFDAVEVDSTYYALPDPANVVRWIAGTPRHFLFGVKSYALFTYHRAKFSSLPDWLRREFGSRADSDFIRREDLSPEQRHRLFDAFIQPVRLLHEAGRLAYVLFQFPPYWSFGREPLIYFRRLREVCGPLPIAVEVRNASWFERSHAEIFTRVLMNENIAYVAADEPALPWTVPPEWPITAEWGTVARFHGRNEAAWRNPRASVHERFDYDYAPRELAEWRPRIEGALSAARGRIYLMFNNCVSDKAARAAQLMREMLGIADRVPPEGRQTSLGLN